MQPFVTALSVANKEQNNYKYLTPSLIENYLHTQIFIQKWCKRHWQEHDCVIDQYTCSYSYLAQYSVTALVYKLT